MMTKFKITSKWQKIVRCVLFVFVFLTLFVWVSYLLRPISASRQNICGYYAEKEQSIDAVYIGGSACYVFWMPLRAWKSKGFTSYNFAADGMPPQMLKYYLIEALKTQTPKVVILDVRGFQYGEISSSDGPPYMYLETWIRNSTDSFKYSANRFNAIKNCISPQIDLVEMLLDISLYHTNWNSLNENSVLYSLNQYPNKLKGFGLVEDYANIGRPNIVKTPEMAVLSPRMERVLQDLCEYCAQLHDVKVLFIVHPYAITQGEQSIYNYIESVTKEYGLDFLNCCDYFDEMDLDFSKDFYQESHVNIFGAEKFTDFLADFLMSRYEFEDKRENYDYANWNADYIPWLEDVARTKQAVESLILQSQQTEN